MTTNTDALLPDKWRKKPVVIEAVQFDGKFTRNVLEFCGDCAFQTLLPTGHYLYIRTLEGDMKVSPNDWIIKGVRGEVYPCKPDIFEATYERASLPSAQPSDVVEATGQQVDELANHMMKFDFDPEFSEGLKQWYQLARYILEWQALTTQQAQSVGVQKLIKLVEKAKGMIICDISAYKRFHREADEAIAPFTQNKVNHTQEK